MSLTARHLNPVSTNLSASRQKALLIVVALLIGLVIVWLPLRVGAALILGTALFLIIVLQPLAGLALTLVAGPFGAYENHLFGTSVPESGQILLLVTLSAWLAHGISRRRMRLPFTPLNRPLMVFLLVALVSLLGTRSLDFGLKEVLKWIELGLVMLMIVDLWFESIPKEDNSRTAVAKPRFSVRWLLAMILVAGVSQSLIGIWQFGIRGDGPDHFMILDRFYRAYGTFQQPNPFGGYMAISAFLAIGALAGMLVHWSRRGNPHRLKPETLLWIAFLGVCALLTGLGLVLSWSRGAWLASGVAAIALVLFLPTRRWLGLLLVALVVGLFLLGSQLNLLPSTIVTRLGSFGQDLTVGDVRGADIDEANYAVIERLAHWQAGAEMARDNLWLGVGFGNYEPAYPDYALLNWPFPLGHAHNYYLNIVAETGVVGATAYLLFWIAVFLQALRLLRLLDWPQRGIALGLLAGWTALATHHLVDKMYVNNLFIFMGALLGLQQVLCFSND